MKLNIETSSVFTRLWEAKDVFRVLILEGSSRSTKTYSIIQMLILFALDYKNPITITISRKRRTWIPLTVLIDFEYVLKNQFNLYNEDNFNKSELTYQLFNATFNFIGLDEPQKLHGKKQHIFWLNEAIEDDYKDFEQLILRTTLFGILDYNPSSEYHWIYDKVCNRDDALLIHSTYKDNPFLEEAIIREIERLEPTETNIKAGTADEVSWKIYGLGLRASQKGLIYPEITIVKEMPAIEDRKKTFYGQDYGYTNDPSVLVEIALAKGELWIDEKFYEKGLVNLHNHEKPHQPSIEKKYEECGLKHKPINIWGDSAEPKTNDELSSKGYNVRGVIKGQDSIVNGIDVVKRYKINVTERSVNTIREFRNYKWFVDKNGIATNKPIDAFNHAMDGIRYGCMMELKEQNIYEGLADAMGF